MILVIGCIGIIIFLPNAWAVYINCTAPECYGTVGNDILNFQTQKEDIQMWGRDGNDKMLGGSGQDSMVGNEGDDEIGGVLGNDKIWGENGNDIITGGPGADILAGGEGNDIIYNYYESQNLRGSDRSKDVIFCGEGNDIAWLGYREDSYSGDCEVIHRAKAPPLANNPPPPPASNTIPPRGNEDCDRPEMPGCP